MNVTVSLGAAKMAKDVAAAGVHLLRVESGVSVGLKSLHIGLVESALTHSAVPGPIIQSPAHSGAHNLFGFFHGDIAKLGYLVSICRHSSCLYQRCQRKVSRKHVRSLVVYSRQMFYCDVDSRNIARLSRMGARGATAPADGRTDDLIQDA